MTHEKLDYKKIGLMCGIEIHQKLNTNKLFCNCPTTLRDDNPDIIVKRKLSAVAGETGQIDVAAQHEMDKDLTFIYEGYSDTTCLVEFDDEPPHDMNQEALDIVLQSSLMMNAKIVDEIQVMRKTVVNGSNTSGFQRTALVSRNGYLDTSEGKVHIPTISIEEDSAKDISKNDNIVTYRLDRLGTPLIEIGTDPDIKTPEQAKETAQMIGMILRSTGKVARGIGTIRQDVNVSIKGGNRIEIKGAQDLKLIPTYVEYEALRQMALIKLKEEVKDFKTDTLIHDITDLFKSSESKIIKSALQKKGVVKAIKVSKFNGILGREVQPGKRVGSEISDFAKVKAQVGGLFHSDELPKYGITEDDVANIIKTLKIEKQDGFILIADTKTKVDIALSAAIERIELFKKGVIKEVRKANPDGTTSFMRPMPGAARMYPETDVKPIRPNIKDIKLPELISDKIKRLAKEYSISNDLATMIAKEKPEIENEFKQYSKLEPTFIATVNTNIQKDLKRTEKIEITDEQLEEYKSKIFPEIENKSISKNSFKDIVIDASINGKLNLAKFKLMSQEDIVKTIEQIIKKNSGAPFNALMGICMKELKGKAEGSLISKILQEKAN